MKGELDIQSMWLIRKVAASLLANDPRYKKFATQVDRALQSFENVNEWADFISFLSRLLKVGRKVEGAHADADAPNTSSTLSRNTAQTCRIETTRAMLESCSAGWCASTGVGGIRAYFWDNRSELFAFELILSLYHSLNQVEGLKRDLLIWSSGLFPFFQFATTSVRPHLLNIYDAYYLPLGEELRPATKAMILALLPGMEEETGDFFDRVSSSIDTA